MPCGSRGRIVFSRGPFLLNSVPIEIAGGPFSRDEQRALVETLVRVGVEPETASLVVLVDPCIVAVVGDEQEAAARLSEAGYEARLVGGRPGEEHAPRPTRGLVAVAIGLGIVAAGLLGIVIGRGLVTPAEPAPSAAVMAPPGAEALPGEAPPEPLAEVPAGAGTWGSGTASIPGETDGAVTLRSVRTGRHDGFDRTVFEFDGDVLPGVQISAADRPEAACGSGEVVGVEGAAWLAVRFQPAQAHTGEGTPTVTDRRQSPRLPTLQELALTCDFEAEVAWTLGLSAARPYRTLVLRTPLRLVLDVQNTP